MPFIDAQQAVHKEYDVIVVGSGAGGGQIAYTLTMEGVRVLMLEAGRKYEPSEAAMFQTPDLAPLRADATPEKPFGFYDATVDGGWQVPGEPYTVGTGEGETDFLWWRSRMLGGRTNHWGRISLRNGPYDFKPQSRDGLGINWPIAYEDLASYYDKVEMLVGVYGSHESLENTPDSPDGCLLSPPKPIVSDLLIQRATHKLGFPTVACHRAVLTQALDWKRLPALLHPGNATAQKIIAHDMRQRVPCFWATPCGSGCAIRANYQSTTVHLPPALATGKLDILTDAMVAEVKLRKNGRASGVLFVDRRSGKTLESRARVVVLAASAFETVRILLNSHPAGSAEGLANSSGRLGRYLMDTVGSSLSGQIPILENLPPHNEEGASGAHVYVPWWGYEAQRAGKLDFPRGYHIEVGGGRRMPGFDTLGGLEWLTGGSYGLKLKEDARRYYGSMVDFAGRGEMIPNEKSYCEVDSQVKDRWGIPVLRFHWQWSEHETRQAAHMQKTFADIIESMGGRVEKPPEKDGARAISAGGSIIHELGGAIMGEDARTSVVNPWCQAWDVHNLFVADGAPFPSNADKNPTLTIMANAWRVADHIVSRMRRREL
ncbi:MAG: GMC family oxidoreductase [Proteobacteria bacterium]|nr:GMC family oxidoreductase [Pseudomonadota bacterium]